MDKDHLERNRLRLISATFLGNTVNRFINIDVERRAHLNGEAKSLNEHITRDLSADLLAPTLKYLIGNKLAHVVNVNDMRGGELLATLPRELETLKTKVEDACFFLYAGDDAYRSILKSEYVYRSNAFDLRTGKFFGTHYDHCGKLVADQILLGAIPKTLIAKEKFIPYFVQEIIDNQ